MAESAPLMFSHVALLDLFDRYLLQMGTIVLLVLGSWSYNSLYPSFFFSLALIWCHINRCKQKNETESGRIV